MFDNSSSYEDENDEYNDTKNNEYYNDDYYDEEEEEWCWKHEDGKYYPYKEPEKSKIENAYK